MRLSFHRHAVLVGLFALAAAGCGDGPARDTTRFVGALAGPTEVGRLEVEFATAADELAEQYAEAGTGPTEPVAVSGRVVFADGRAVELTGRYQRTAPLTYLTGAGYVVGVYLETDVEIDEGVDRSGPLLEGYYAGPDGQGLMVAHSDETTGVEVLCGTFTGGATGRWAMVLGDGATALAVPIDRTARGYLLLGKVAGDSVDLEEEAVSSRPATSATGILSGDRRSAGGAWSGDRAGGEWTASTTGCQHAPA